MFFYLNGEFGFRYFFSFFFDLFFRGFVRLVIVVFRVVSFGIRGE